MHRLSPIFICIACALSLPVIAEEFLWRTEDISAEVKRDDKYLMIGQYLYLTQKLRPKEAGWTAMKIDIPDTWKVKQVAVSHGKISILNEDGTRYELTRDNVSELDFAILDGGKKSNQQLQELWQKHARVKPLH